MKTNRKIRWLTASTLIPALATLLACSGSPVRSYSDKDIHPAKGQSFRWLTQEDADNLKLQDPKVDYVTSSVKVEQRPAMEEKLKPEIEKSLAEQGYVKDETGQPELLVTFFAKTKDQDWVSSWKGFTPGIENVPVVIFPDFDKGLARSYRDGVVYIVLYSSRTKAPVWTGVDTGLATKQIVSEADIMASIDRLMSELKATA